MLTHMIALHKSKSVCDQRKFICSLRYCLFSFNMGQEQGPSSRDHRVLKKSGSCRLDLSFTSTSDNEQLTLLVLAESDETIT